MNNDSHDSGTRSFDPIPPEDKKANTVDNIEIKQKLTIGIFSVIILILLSFAILIFGQIFSTISQRRKDADKGKNNDPFAEYIQIPVDTENVKIGDLLLVSEAFPYSYSANTEENIVKAEDDWDPSLYSLVKMDGSIRLNAEALSSFKKMIYDYCQTGDGSSATEKNQSNITLAWGYSDEATLESDVSVYSKTFYDNATGNTITLQRSSDSGRITESILASDYKWLYDNMYKYGFILRYPNGKEAKTGFNSKERVHLRYVGYENAYYMHENDLCLEEYLELIRTEYKYGSKHLTFDCDDGSSYEIYYVESTGSQTNVPVPKESDHRISGDNMNGFIVTIKK